MDYKEVGAKCIATLKNRIKKTEALKLINVHLKDGKPSYLDATNLAVEIGNICGSILDSLDFSDVPVDELRQFASNVLAELYKYGQDFMNDICQQVQQEMNDIGKIGINALKIPVDKSRIDNIVKRYAEADAFDDVAFLTGADVAGNVMRSVVQDNINENARFHSKAGLKNKLIRHTGSNGCCEWCQSMAGEYDYGTEPSDFWAIHKDCTCWIEYRVGRTASAIRFETDSKGARVKKTENI